MKKVNLNNLYESPYPLENIDSLWVDKDENTGKIRAIHEYNKSKGEWEPSMVSIDFMKPDEEGEVTSIFYDNGNSFSKQILKDETNKHVVVCLIHNDWINPATELADTGIPCVATGPHETSTRDLSYRMTEVHKPVYSNGDTAELQLFLGGREVNSGVEDCSTQWILFSNEQYQAFKAAHSELEPKSLGNKFRFVIVYKITHKL